MLCESEGDEGAGGVFGIVDGASGMLHKTAQGSDIPCVTFCSSTVSPKEIPIPSSVIMIIFSLQ